jgi:hypothetical protein
MNIVETPTQPGATTTRRPDVAVCDDGTLIPLTRDQSRDNFLERGPTLSQQFARDDIAFVASGSIADKWTTRESVIEAAAQHRKWAAETL